MVLELLQNLRWEKGVQWKLNFFHTFFDVAVFIGIGVLAQYILFIVIKCTEHKIYHLNHFECAVQGGYIQVVVQTSPPSIPTALSIV